jgi:Replication protein
MSTYQKSLHPTTTFLEPRSSSGKGRLIALLRQAGLAARAARVARCCAEFWALRCPHRHLARAIPTERCQYRLCPKCARWRRARAVARVWPAIQQLLQQFPDDRWVLITLTVVSTHEPLKRIVLRLRGHFARLRRSALWRRCIRGGVYSIETTYHPTTGWHVHLHVLAARQAWCDQKELAAAWQRASRGEGQVVDIRDRDQDVRSGRCASLKYLFKPPTLRGWGPEQVAEFDALARLKLGECFGALRGLSGPLEAAEDGGAPRAGAREAPLPEGGAPCPACGLPLAWAREPEAEVQAMMWVTARPISLALAQATSPPWNMPDLDQGLVGASGDTPP